MKKKAGLRGSFCEGTPEQKKAKIVRDVIGIQQSGESESDGIGNSDILSDDDTDKSSGTPNFSDIEATDCIQKSCTSLFSVKDELMQLAEVLQSSTLQFSSFLEELQLPENTAAIPVSDLPNFIEKHDSLRNEVSAYLKTVSGLTNKFDLAIGNMETSLEKVDTAFETLRADQLTLLEGGPARITAELSSTYKKTQAEFAAASLLPCDLRGLCDMRAPSPELHALLNSLLCSSSLGSDQITKWQQCNSLRCLTIECAIAKAIRRNFCSPWQLGLTAFLSVSGASVKSLSILNTLGIGTSPQRAKKSIDLAAQDITPLSRTTYVLLAADNCGYKLRTRTVNAEHRTMYLNTVNWVECSVGLPRKFQPPDPVSLFSNMRVWAETIRLSSTAENTLCQSLFEAAANLVIHCQVPPTTRAEPPITRRAVFQVQEPFLPGDRKGLQVAFDGNFGNSVWMAEWVSSLVEHYVQGGRCPALLLAGDEQLFEVLWKLKLREPDRFASVIPLVGWFHFQWRVQKAIFYLAGDWFLVGLARRNGRTAAQIQDNSQANNFRFCDDLLAHFTAASIQYFSGMMAKCPGRSVNIIEFLDSLHHNSPAYDILYLTVYFLVPYCFLRQAIRYTDIPLLIKVLPSLLQLFIITRRVKYSRLTVLWLRYIGSLSPEWSSTAWRASITGLSEGGFGTGLDGVVEYINLLSKTSLPVEARQPEQIRSTVKALNITEPLALHFEKLLHMRDRDPETMQSTTESRQNDIGKMHDCLEVLFGTDVTQLRSPVEHKSLWNTKGDTPFKGPIAHYCDNAISSFSSTVCRLGVHMSQSLRRQAPAAVAAAAAPPAAVQQPDPAADNWYTADGDDGDAIADADDINASEGQFPAVDVLDFSPFNV